MSCSSGYGVGQEPDPGVLSMKPETVPVKDVDVVTVPVVLTTTTNCAPAGTVKEYDAFPIVVPRPEIPLSPR